MFGGSSEFWLNAQRRSGLGDATPAPRERARINRAHPLTAAEAPEAMKAHGTVAGLYKAPA